jgi:hypothetical protein
MVSYDMHDSVSSAKNQVPSEIRKNDVNLQAQVKPLPIYGLASDLTPTLRNHWDQRGRTDSIERDPPARPQIVNSDLSSNSLTSRCRGPKIPLHLGD